MNQRTILSTLFTIALGAASLSAGPITYNLYNNTVSGTVPAGLTMSKSGWSLNTLTSNFATATLYTYSGGLGETSAGEVMTSPQHTVDNSGKFEFVLFSFSKPVNINSAYLTAYGDTDITFWTSASQVTSLSGQSLASLGALGFGSAIANNGGTSSRTAILSGANVRSLLLGASITNFSTADYVKIKDLCITPGTTPPPPPPSGVPEPSTFGLLGASLVGLGYSLRRRKA